MISRNNLKTVLVETFFLTFQKRSLSTHAVVSVLHTVAITSRAIKKKNNTARIREDNGIAAGEYSRFQYEGREREEKNKSTLHFFIFTQFQKLYISTRLFFDILVVVELFENYIFHIVLRFTSRLQPITRKVITFLLSITYINRVYEINS